MFHADSVGNRRQHRGITACLRALGDRLFVASDHEARIRGWEIHRTRLGLGRSYRDPRWDRFVRCAQCRGSGIPTVATSASCPACRGSGRLGTEFASLHRAGAR